MPDLLVPNLDQSVIERLEVRARDGGRSLEAELKLILEQAIQSVPGVPVPFSRSNYRSLADRIRVTLENRSHSSSTEMLAEDRAR